MKIVGVIPARFGSTRFPGKALALVAGKPLIQRVIERCLQASRLRAVMVATDDERIREAAQPYCAVAMTRSNHPTGTDRVAEAVETLSCDGIVNIQGDEPLIDPAVIDAVAGALLETEMSTAATPVRDGRELENPNVTKVVVDSRDRALYFSRSMIPYLRDLANHSLNQRLTAFPFLKHLGIYGYRRETLLRLVRFPMSPLERAERLEQLRALENGIEVAVVRVDYESIGVDVPGDVRRVEERLARMLRTVTP